MSKFLLTGVKMSGTMTVEFDENEFLKCWQIDAQLSPEQWLFLNENPVLTYSKMCAMEAKKVFQVERVPDDLSFAVFWELYGYKVGNMKRTRQIWESLIESEKAVVLLAIPKYKRFLSLRSTLDQAHASTWLSQRRWENDYSSWVK